MSKNQAREKWLSSPSSLTAYSAVLDTVVSLRICRASVHTRTQATAALTSPPPPSPKNHSYSAPSGAAPRHGLWPGTSTIIAKGPYISYDTVSTRLPGISRTRHLLETSTASSLDLLTALLIVWGNSIVAPLLGRLSLPFDHTYVLEP